MSLKIVIYKDDGVGEFGVQCLLNTLKPYEVKLCSAQDVIDGQIFNTANFFIMPGGADLPYCRKLNGIGNTNIRRFVNLGGTYFGICAGAYYGCHTIEFHKGRPDEISGKRELAFTSAVGIGSLTDLAPPYDQSLFSAAVIPITLKEGYSINAYYHGGPAFCIPAPDHERHIIHGLYPNKKPAIIESRFGQGRVILSGVHLEFGVDDLDAYPVSDEAERAKISVLQNTMNEAAAKFLFMSLIKGLNT